MGPSSWIIEHSLLTRTFLALTKELLRTRLAALATGANKPTSGWVLLPVCRDQKHGHVARQHAVQVRMPLSQKFQKQTSFQAKD